MGNPSLGSYLRDIRAARHLTLRDVERITAGKVSNAYLSQLEGDQIANPGIIMLHRLSAAYGVDFGDMCAAACVESSPQPSPKYCPTCGQILWESDHG